MSVRRLAPAASKTPAANIPNSGRICNAWKHIYRYAPLTRQIHDLVLIATYKLTAGYFRMSDIVRPLSPLIGGAILPKLVSVNFCK